MTSLLKERQRGWEGSPHVTVFLTFLSPAPAATEFKKPEDTGALRDQLPCIQRRAGQSKE